MNEPDTRKIQLSDGRQLSYSDIGTGDNGTWIHCHGIPGSRYELTHLNKELVAAGLRIIVPDRPGYGASTPCPSYDFRQHTADLCQLADHSGLKRFSVSGFSGGGVFALALAHGLGARVEQLSIAATPAVPLMENPFDYASELTAGSWHAALADMHQFADQLQSLTGPDNALADGMMDAVGAKEKQHLSSARIQPAFRQSMNTALQQGALESASALARDTRLTAQPWPFHPAELKLPVRIIHGTDDHLVHRQHFRALFNQIPQSKQVSPEGKGHFEVLPWMFVADYTA
ncbi:alpha/beta fold hydrolase [Marinobacter halotolerans]|uniref:alpha/beta fold hydrolase n=1 Tax=Marinobacter halotolerans TaxID=1569211 RepID=UPI001243AA93|nr:alpha/beta hydrolase [Marinobacter halotolerans]